MPAPATPSWRFWQTDLYLQPRRRGTDVYFAGRPGLSGADIGHVVYERGRWSSFSRVLWRDAHGWDAADLGEPAVFRVGESTYMLYVGLGTPGGPRQSGLARKTRRGWIRCGKKPFIAIGRRFSRSNAIDPEPLVLGNRLYVYFGGGQTASLGGNMDGVILVRTYRLSS